MYCKTNVATFIDTRGTYWYTNTYIVQIMMKMLKMNRLKLLMIREYKMRHNLYFIKQFLLKGLSVAKVDKNDSL